MTEPEAGTSHHAAAMRAIKVRGVDYVAVDDLAAMFTDMAQAMPEAKLAQVLTTLVEAIGARPQESTPRIEPPTRPCPGCGVRVQTFPQQDRSRPYVVLNTRPVPHGHWMVTQTSTGLLAVPFNERQHAGLGVNVARFREHTCSGPFAAPAGRPR